MHGISLEEAREKFDLKRQKLGEPKVEGQYMTNK
jgi:hypothetical protein